MVHINIHQICQQAVNAFECYKKINRKKRYDFLQKITKNISDYKHDIIAQAHTDTNLMIDDLMREFDRTILQIYDYSKTLLHISDSSYDTLSLNYEPLGSIVVFGASNFPLAYSTAGGDVISALVAGCAVIFKAHEAHLKTSRLVNDAIQKAILESDMPHNIYQHLEVSSYDEAKILIQQPEIKAVGFTGSLTVGRILFDICQARHEPIPFFGELGSLNPVFICSHYFKINYKKIACEYADSFIKRYGQVCVHPSVLIIPETEVTQEFYQLLSDNLSKKKPYKMLTEKIFSEFKQGCDHLKKHYQIITPLNPIQQDTITPALFSVSVNEWLYDTKLHNEVFGAIGIAISYQKDDELYQVAHSFSGQLTASIHGNESDKNNMLHLEKILTQKVGRLIYNQYPTNVIVDYHMQHGGVYPASTCSQFTAVGTRAILRFLRPLCYQNKPEFLQDYKNHHNFFPTKSASEQAILLADFVAQKLNEKILKNGFTTLAVSGGKSPIEFLQALSHKNLKWDNVTISLVDERCINRHSNDSNSKLIHNNLLINKAKYAHFIDLYDNQSIETSLNNLNTGTIIPQKFDCVILGMGEDGHFASLFPHSNNLHLGLTDVIQKYSLQTAVSEPKQRISMNVPFIIQSDIICLAIMGGKKLEILDTILKEDKNIYPIDYLLQKAKINIFYVE